MVISHLPVRDILKANRPKKGAEGSRSKGTKELRKEGDPVTCCPGAWRFSSELCSIEVLE